jgi:hypothetical protein
MRMRDYGGDIPCPECGQKHHISPRQLQGDLQIEFTCARAAQTSSQTMTWRVQSSRKWI